MTTEEIFRRRRQRIINYLNLDDANLLNSREKEGFVKKIKEYNKKFTTYFLADALIFTEDSSIKDSGFKNVKLWNIDLNSLLEKQLSDSEIKYIVLEELREIPEEKDVA